jgi:hypothetical protein
MAFDPAPTAWLANYSSNGTAISLPIATFPALTSAEANTTTGDIRKILYAFCDKLTAAWNASSTADRPSKWTLTSTAVIDAATGQITRTYTFRFLTAASGEEVVNE